MSTDRPLLGIALMMGFCVLAPMGDAVAKMLGPRIPLLQMVAVRFALQAVILLPFILATGRSFAMSPRVLRFVTLRTALHIAGTGFMYGSLLYLPLADAVAIAFVMPFLMLLMGRVFLGEEVGYRRLTACAVGFLGTLMVVQPSFAAVGLPALLPLGVAVVFSAFMLVTRIIAREIDPVVLQCTSGGMAGLVLIPAALFFEGTGLAGLDPVWPVGLDWPLLAALAVLGVAAHVVMAWSLRFAPTSTLAPMQYLEIPVAALIGLLVFGDFPNGLALAGIGVTIGAGLYIIAREQRLSRSAPGPLPPAPPAV